MSIEEKSHLSDVSGFILEMIAEGSVFPKFAKEGIEGIILKFQKGVNLSQSEKVFLIAGLRNCISKKSKEFFLNIPEHESLEGLKWTAHEKQERCYIEIERQKQKHPNWKLDYIADEASKVLAKEYDLGLEVSSVIQYRKLYRKFLKQTSP